MEQTEDTAQEILIDIFTKSMDALLDKESAPTSRNTLFDCGVATLLALLDQYVDDDTKLARELDNLLKRFQNNDDEIVRLLSVSNRAQVQSVTNALLQRRRHVRSCKEDKNAAQG